MSNHKITLRYDGRAYFGWQRHGDQPTIQGTVEAALERVVGAPCQVHGAGRTDRGVHAEGQVLNVHLAAALAPDEAVGALNAALPEDIRILAVEPVPDDFHARADACAKVYRYEIWNGADCPAADQGRVWHLREAVDAGAMARACPLLEGRHDFASFVTPSKHEPRSTERHMRRVALATHGQRISITMEADGFLYKMVRNIVRALVKVGEGRSTVADLAAILAKRDRQAAPGTAPASGLYLDLVRYPPAE